MKINVSVFSRNQLVMSVVPINEFDQQKRNTMMYANIQAFFLNGTRVGEMAMVKGIDGVVS